jgi:threonylcarbamoyladenosine tRNA methylthiotransferase MtaB
VTDGAAAVESIAFGCRLNLVESEAMRAWAQAAAGPGGIVVVNTCAVTAEATRQARQAIRRVAREQPDARVVVTGCGAQTEPAVFAAMPEVANVIGNAEKRRPETWATLDTAPRVNVGTPSRGAAFDAAHVVEGRTRAFVEIQNGCDHRCTFCVIPHGRGDSRSAPAAEVVSRVAALVDAGAKDVSLTGVDLTSWGAGLDGAPRLGSLVRAILRGVPALSRLRLSSIDCVEADEELLRAFAEEERLAPHLHLSLQSGDDLVLKRMKRRHSRGEAAAFCEDLRARRPDIVFGADFIAGFPTETEAMFQNTLAMVDDCGLTHLHVFPFSPREQTPAARMPAVAREVAKERAARLRDKGARARDAHLRAQVGKRVEFLSERGGVSRARDFTLAKTPGVEAGRLFMAEATGVDSGALRVDLRLVQPSAIPEGDVQPRLLKIAP